MTDQEVTLGEVFRAVIDLRADVKDLEKNLIGRAEYESDKAGHATAHAEIRADISEVRKESNRRIDETREEARKRMDGFVRFAAWASAAIGALLLAVFVFILPHLGWTP